MLNKKILIGTMLSTVILVLCSCNSANNSSSISSQSLPQQNIPLVSAAPTPQPTPDIYLPVYTTPPFLPSADGTQQVGSSIITIDVSNTNQGYIMALYNGTHSGKIKFRVQGPDGRTYTYDLHGKTGYQVFPLTGGNGSYTFTTFEQSSGDEYYLVDQSSTDAQLENEFVAYLYPNQFVDFNASSKLVNVTAELAKENETVIQFVEKVYNYTMDNMTYDESLASAVSAGGKSGYLPDLDFAIDNKTGICFDYASLMTAMLRSQGIPTKLVVGWSGDIYHAWINVYIEGEGWVNGLIQFNGNEWKLMDPTFADNGNQEDWIMQYIGNGSNYSEKYVY